MKHLHGCCLLWRCRVGSALNIFIATLVLFMGLFVMMNVWIQHHIGNDVDNKIYNIPLITKHHYVTKTLDKKTQILPIEKGECPKKMFPQLQQQHAYHNNNLKLFDYYVNEYKFYERGGIMIFFHIAKTGGITIRKLMGMIIEQYQQHHEENVTLHYKRVYTLRQLQAKIPMYIETYLQPGDHRRNILFLELHGSFGDPVPGIIQIESTIQQLRQYTVSVTTGNHNVKNKHNHNDNRPLLFLFTLLRSPLYFYVSYFHFFKRPKCIYSYCHFPTVKVLNEYSLLQTALYNHQCFYLYQHYDHVLLKYYNRNNYSSLQNIIEHNNNTLESCQLTHQYMYRYMDYIGTTENISNETLPLLFAMFQKYINTSSDHTESQPYDPKRHNDDSLLSMAREELQLLLSMMMMNDTRHSHRGTVTLNENHSTKRSLQVHNLSSDTLYHLQLVSSYDQFMYDCSIRNFNLSLPYES